MSDRILTAQQAAELLQIHPETMRRMLKRGRIPGHKIGRAWRILESEIRRLVMEGISGDEINGPRQFSEAGLARVGVHIRDLSAGIIGCNKCGRGWAVSAPGLDHRLPAGYWHCPNECNVPTESEEGS